MPISRAAHPWLYALNVERHRLRRRLRQAFSRVRYARPRSGPETTFRIARHRSVLIRTLGVSDLRLQHNKVTNLRLAAAAIDNTVIRPGETFSFWRLVGRPSARRGFVPGMLLSQGQVIEGVGGGLCQMGNLLYWLFLHSPLEVTERFRHGYDVFPDSGRVLPFGSGATVFYNYVDLQAVNRTNLTFRLRVRVGERFLYGALFADAETFRRYHVVERDHRFFADAEGVWWRENQLWREVVDASTGQLIVEEDLLHNLARVMYDPSLASQDRDSRG
ncbi:MAG: VanW family protein [bacterium]